MEMISMVLGLLIGLAGVKFICDVVGEYGKAACPGLDNHQYDLDNGVKGISVIGESNIMKIAARNGVRPNKHGILPYFGYRGDCTDYVRRYANDSSDVDKFIREWQRVSKDQEKRASRRIQSESQSSYERIAAQWRSAKFDGNRTITHTVVDHFNLTIEEHQAMVDDIYENTVLKELCVAKPVVRKHESIYAYRTVYWRIKARKTDKQDDWKTNTDWKALYNLCCKHCGYI